MANKRVYFSFHYKDVSEFRANVVRKHKVFGFEDTDAGYIDASIWEKSKMKGDLALKRLIDKELKYTSVTVVLIGSDTYSRPWVRYEIMKSLEQGNRLLGIHINSIAGASSGYALPPKPRGPNPFEYLAVSMSTIGARATLSEFREHKWVPYDDLETFNLQQRPVVLQLQADAKLSEWIPTYDWIADNGYPNFSKWIGASY